MLLADKQPPYCLTTADLQILYILCCSCTYLAISLHTHSTVMKDMRVPPLPTVELLSAVCGKPGCALEVSVLHKSHLWQDFWFQICACFLCAPLSGQASPIHQSTQEASIMLKSLLSRRTVLCGCLKKTSVQPSFWLWLPKGALCSDFHSIEGYCAPSVLVLKRMFQCISISARVTVSKSVWQQVFSASFWFTTRRLSESSRRLSCQLWLLSHAAVN